MSGSAPEPAGFLPRWALPSRWTPRQERLVLAVVLGVYAAGLLAWAVGRDFITYRQDFGETLVAYKQSANLRETFPRYGMLHVEKVPSGQELVYTHNVNLGTYYFFLLRTLGLEDRHALTLGVLPIHLLGLLAAYLATRRITGSRPVALVFLALLLLDFANVGAFAFNALRAWHYVGLFLLLWGAYAAGQPPPAGARWRPVALLVAGALVAFGCGYDFFVIAGASAGALVLFSTTLPRLLPALAWLAFASLVPFILRQLEVIYWMGLHTWFTDFYLTFAIKVPFASRFIAIPSMAEIDGIYANAGLLRPPAYPTSDFAGIRNTAEPLLRLATVPAYGLLGCLLVLAAALAGLGAAVLARGSSAHRLLTLPAIYFWGAATGLFIFAPFSLHVYLKHNFPLVAGLVHLVEACGLVLCLGWAGAAATAGRRFTAALPAAVAVFLLGNAVAVQVGNAYASKELDFRWTKYLQAGVRPAVVATVMLPPESDSIIAPGVRQHVLTADLAPWILARASHRLVDRPLVEIPALDPDAALLVYAPGDGWCNLDAREPDLRHRDWLSAALQPADDPLALSQRLAQAVAAVIVRPPGAVHPDDILHLKFLVVIPPGAPLPRGVPELEVETAEGRVRTFHNIIDDLPQGVPTGAAALIFNAKFSILHVYVRLPRDLFAAAAGPTRLSFRGSLRYPTATLRSEPVTVDFSPTATRVALTPVLPEPTTGQLCGAFTRHRVVERSRSGSGYAVLELDAH